MTIIYKDGGTLDAEKIEINGTTLYIDDIYTAEIDEIETIEA